MILFLFLLTTLSQFHIEVYSKGSVFIKSTINYSRRESFYQVFNKLTYQKETYKSIYQLKYKPEYGNFAILKLSGHFYHPGSIKIFG